MKSDVRELEDGRFELSVELPQEQVSQAIEEEYRELAKTTKVPGFRQGKVPREVLERRFGLDVVIHSVIEKLVPPSYPRAVDEHGLKPIELPDVQVDEYAGGPITYKATFEVEPEASIEAYEGIEVTVAPIDVSDDEVEEQVERLRDRMSKLEVVEDRAVQQGDFALIDFKGFLDDIEFEGGAGSDFLLEIGSGRFLPGFEDGLVGAEKGEEKEVWIDVPGDYHGTQIAGKRVRFDVTVKEIKAKVKPEADDEFASEASEFDTVDELRRNIHEQITAGKKHGADLKAQSQILDWLESNVEVEVPQKMIDSKHERLLEEFLQMIQGQGLTLEEYFRLSDSSQEVLRASMEAEAAKRAREELALDAIARAEGIEVTEPDVDEELAQFAERVGENVDEVRKRMEERGGLSDVRAGLTRRKTLDWLSERAAVTFKEEEPEADESVGDEATPEPAPDEGSEEASSDDAVKEG